MTTPTDHTVNSILKSLGYPDPIIAARQQGQMILLGRLAHYQAARQQLESKWGLTLTQMQQQYQQEGHEEFEVDDDYVQWQWYAEAIANIESQLQVLTTG